MGVLHTLAAGALGFLLGAALATCAACLAGSQALMQERYEGRSREGRQDEDDRGTLAILHQHGIFPYLTWSPPSAGLVLGGGLLFAVMTIILSVMASSASPLGAAAGGPERPRLAADLVLLALFGIFAWSDYLHRWLPDEADFLFLILPLLLLDPAVSPDWLTLWVAGAGIALLLQVSGSLFMAIRGRFTTAWLGKADICAMGALLAWFHDRMTDLIEAGLIVLLASIMPPLLARMGDLRRQARAKPSPATSYFDGIALPLLPILFVTAALALAWPLVTRLPEVFP